MGTPWWIDSTSWTGSLQMTHARFRKKIRICLSVSNRCKIISKLAMIYWNIIFSLQRAPISELWLCKSLHLSLSLMLQVQDNICSQSRPFLWFRSANEIVSWKSLSTASYSNLESTWQLCGEEVRLWSVVFFKLGLKITRQTLILVKVSLVSLVLL